MGVKNTSMQGTYSIYAYPDKIYTSLQFTYYMMKNKIMLGRNEVDEEERRENNRIHLHGWPRISWI